MKFNVKRYFQVLGILLSIILLGALVVIGMDYFDFSILDRSSPSEQTDNDGSISDESINLLLLCTDNEGLLTDSIMVASYDPETNDVHMLSIPRDTRMYVGSRYQKINAAHAIGAMVSKENMAGPEGSIEAVQRLTGIPINYYLEFSFFSVQSLMDAIGPVHFEIPDIYGDGVGMVYDDPVQGLHINLPPGEYDLTGEQVVQLLRYRKGNKGTKGANGYPNGDRGRIEVQQKFLKALVDQKLNAGMILRIPAIFKSMSETIDTNLTVSDVLKYSKYLTNFTSTNIHTYSLPGRDSEPDEIPDSKESFWIPDMDAIRELVEGTFGYDASDITIEKGDGTNKATPAPVGSGKRTAKRTASPETSPTATSAPRRIVEDEDEPDGYQGD